MQPPIPPDPSTPPSKRGARPAWKVNYAPGMQKNQPPGGGAPGDGGADQGVELSGIVERITFYNEENGFTVARLTPHGERVEVTITGSMIALHPGEQVRLGGSWGKHADYGAQFEVTSCQVEQPATVDGMRKYLGSGLIRGIGPVFARRIVETFGAHTLEVIESQLDRLREVPGIGELRIQRIRLAWIEQKQIKEIMLFLHGHSVSTRLAVKIFRQYGEDSIKIVQNDPYRLARDIFGIGFKTADKIARQMGFAADAPARIQAGLLFALWELSNDGHCFATRAQLLDEAQKLLEAPQPACAAGLDALLQMGELTGEDEALYLPPFYSAETGAARKLSEMHTAPGDRLAHFRDADWEALFATLDVQGGLQLTPEQLAAVRTALTSKVSVITGGPGTGKSTIVSSIVSLLHSAGNSVLLAAPTGRAAKRLSELSGCEAKTIHRLLEYSPTAKSSFLRDRQNPLDADLVIIDEASMVDILLAYHLLSAIENGSHLLLVGDVDQLPSVGAGNVLRDLIASAAFPVARLETIFRQANDSHIILNAHRINQGQQPVFPGDSCDFFIFPARDAETAAAWVLDVVTQRIPKRFGFDPHEDIQVLCPMHRGAAGVGELNLRLQETLNPPHESKPEVRRGQQTLLRLGDRVMQLRNDYERLVFNGDMGRITHIDLEDQLVVVEMDGRRIDYDYTQLDELTLSYAISIHKSQGAEYPAVVIPILTQHYMMLQRNLLYTAITRARKLVVLVGSHKAVAMAVRNNPILQRNTRLAQRLMLTPQASLPGDYQKRLF